MYLLSNNITGCKINSEKEVVSLKQMTIDQTSSAYIFMLISVFTPSKLIFTTSWVKTLMSATVNSNNSLANVDLRKDNFQM